MATRVRDFLAARDLRRGELVSLPWARVPARLRIEGADPKMTLAAIDEARRLGPLGPLTAAWVALAPLLTLTFAASASVAAITLLATPVATIAPRLRREEDIGRPGDFARLAIRTVRGVAVRGAAELGKPAPDDAWSSLVEERIRFAVARIALRLHVRIPDVAVWAPHVIAALLRFVRQEDIEPAPEALAVLMSALRKIETEEGGSNGS